MCSIKAALRQTQQHTTTPGLILQALLPDPRSLAAWCPKKHPGTLTFIRQQRPPPPSPMWPAAGAMPWEQGGSRVHECGHWLGAVSPCALIVTPVEGFTALLYFQGKCRVRREAVALKPGNVLQ